MKISPVQFLNITFWVLCGRPILFILEGLWEKFAYTLSIPPHHRRSLALGRELPILYDFLWGSANGKPVDVQGNSPGPGKPPYFPTLLQLDTLFYLAYLWNCTD